MLRTAILARWLALAVAVPAALAQPSNPAVAARQAFDAVDTTPRPGFAEAQRCAQAHASLIGLVRSDQLYLVHYRAGYCELFAALASGDTQRYQKAARDFTQAIALWPHGKRESAPPGLRILPLVARMERGRMAGSYPDSQEQLASLARGAACADSPVMAASFCEALVDTARAWVSWLAGQREAWADAAQAFVLAPATPLSRTAQAWRDWAEGQRLLQERNLAEAARLLPLAVRVLAEQSAAEYPDVVALLGPRPAFADMHFQTGRVLAEAGQPALAIDHFTAALEAKPDLSRALYLRAREREKLDLGPAAFEDYGQAVRLAQQSNDTTWAIGDAFFRRGLLRYRAQKYTEARDEFMHALGSPLSEVSRADLTAWRVLAGVAAGDCLAAGVLETAQRAASEAFPREESRVRVFGCRFQQATDLNALLALEKSAGDLPAEQRQALRARIAGLFADQGVAAEDKADNAGAVAAYQQALAYDDRNAKALFNLGAIHLDRKQFAEAETHFRALVQSHPEDHEALYWLAETVLAQNPPAPRRAEACEYLQRSLAVADPERRNQFQRAFEAARCSR